MCSMSFNVDHLQAFLPLKKISTETKRARTAQSLTPFRAYFRLGFYLSTDAVHVPSFLPI